MFKHGRFGILIAGMAAGCVTGLFGGGGGMVLIPLLTVLTPLRENEIFPASLAIIFPVCIIALFLSHNVDLKTAFPYLLGSLAGGILSGKFGQRIPAALLHRALGLIILWGGFRYLC